MAFRDEENNVKYQIKSKLIVAAIGALIARVKEATQAPLRIINRKLAWYLSYYTCPIHACPRCAPSF
jgi:hypothetical protein